MNLFELRVVLRQLREELRCPHCKAEYPERKIEILESDAMSGVFTAQCKECERSILINVVIERRHRRIISNVQKYHNVGEKISTNDILDIHNALGNLQGDINELFSLNEAK